MPIATITSKGQITIPIETRERLGLEAGTRIQFVEREDGSCEFYPLTGSVMDLAGMFKGHGPAATLEEMDDAIAAAAAESMDP